MSNLTTLIGFVVSLLTVAHGIYYSYAVTIVIGVILAAVSVYFYNSRKDDPITEDELREVLVKVEQNTTAPPVKEEAPVMTIEKTPATVIVPAKVAAVKSSVKKPVVKPAVAVAEKTPPKKRGRRPSKK